MSDDELARLIREQKRDDTPTQEPERFGGDIRTVPLEGFENVSSAVETVHSEGVWRPNRIATLPPRRTRTQNERDLLFRVTENLLADVPKDAEHAIRLVIYSQVSFRNAAEILRTSVGAVQRRLKQAYTAMRKVLALRSGSDEMSFPQREAKDRTDHYQRRYGIAKRAAVCAEKDCITGLSRFNLNNRCRMHTRGAMTESEFNLAYILGVVTRGGRNVRSAATPPSSEVYEHDVWAGPWLVPDTTVEEPAYLDEPYVPVSRGPVDHLIFRGVPREVVTIEGEQSSQPSAAN